MGDSQRHGLPRERPRVVHDGRGRVRERPASVSAVTTVYTDGACSGNPGPGGWAWAVSGSTEYAYGSEPSTTNQRMELTAVLDAVRSHAGPLHVVSDSTYVVNCFRDGWWKGWLRRGWRNSKRQEVANRDLWEPVIAAYRRREAEITFAWVKGHSGDPMNDLVDDLAVNAMRAQSCGHHT
ncbi:MAG: ribonuclease HI [Acidimicrobiia bacterium]|nr:ribonuclease HI [Acidimicrobiia bacterium]